VKLLRGLGLGALILAILFVLALSLSYSTEYTRFRWKNREAWQDGRAEAQLVRTPEGLVELMATQPRLVSVAAWEVGAADAGVLVDADRVRPVAAVTKVLVASALASAFARGERRPGDRLELTQVERFHFPRADLGAHASAMQKLGVTTALTFEQLALATVQWGDPASADALMVELGREALDAEVRRLGIEGLLAPAPFSGDLTQLLQDGVPGAAPDLERSWALGQRLGKDEAFGRRLKLRVEANGMPSYRALREHRRASSHRGTARGYARLMERIATDDTAWGEAMRRWLTWPMARAAVNVRWAQYGTKSGTAVSIVSSTTFAQPIGGKLAVSALFFEDLPTLAWWTLDEVFTQEDLEQALLGDAEARQKLSARLSAGDAGW
jgi:Beta-lactamase enzyme family